MIEAREKKDGDGMLNENIKTIRREKGLSQEELAVKLNVVRQTVSKWERGLLVPDSDLLLSLSEVLETPVAVLLGETVAEKEPDDLKAIAQKLEIINLQLVERKEARRRAWHWGFLILGVVILLTMVCLLLIDLNAPYEDWNRSNPEVAVAGTFYHVFSWVFVRLAPFFFIGTIVGAILTRKRS